jgi:hypothetical protein
MPILDQLAMLPGVTLFQRSLKLCFEVSAVIVVEQLKAVYLGRFSTAVKIRKCYEKRVAVESAVTRGLSCVMLPGRDKRTILSSAVCHSDVRTVSSLDPNVTIA